MKRITLTLLFACCALIVAAQEDIRVSYQGARPTVTDFAWAYLSWLDREADECDREAFSGVYNALLRYRQGQPQVERATLTVDEKNGYILFEWAYDNFVLRVEMCYWNESDGKHKLFAYSHWSYENGKPLMGQYDGLDFFRYNNATKKMRMCDAPGFDVEYMNTTYTLPRQGKDIIKTKWDDNGGKRQTTLKWNGRRFSR